MAKQMEKVQKEEHRTRSELLRKAWRQYFENRYQVYTPSKAEAANNSGLKQLWTQSRLIRSAGTSNNRDLAPLVRLLGRMNTAGQDSG